MARRRKSDTRELFALWAKWAGEAGDELLDRHAHYGEPASRDVSRRYACNLGCTLLWAMSVEFALKYLIYATTPEKLKPTHKDLWRLWNVLPCPVRKTIETEDRRDRGSFDPIADILKANPHALNVRYPDVPMSGPSPAGLGRANHVLMRVIAAATRPPNPSGQGVPPRNPG